MESSNRESVDLKRQQPERQRLQKAKKGSKHVKPIDFSTYNPEYPIDEYPVKECPVEGFPVDDYPADKDYKAVWSRPSPTELEDELAWNEAWDKQKKVRIFWGSRVLRKLQRKDNRKEQDRKSLG